MHKGGFTCVVLFSIYRSILAYLPLEFNSVGVQPSSGSQPWFLDDHDNSTCFTFSTSRGLGPRSITKFKADVLWDPGYNTITLRGSNLRCAPSNVAELTLTTQEGLTQSTWCAESGRCELVAADTSDGQAWCDYSCYCTSTCSRLVLTYRSKIMPVQNWQLCDIEERGVPSDCQGYYDAGFQLDGAYHVQLTTDGGVKTIKQVFCDMTTDGGGWTILLRRVDGSVDFQSKLWNDYKLGFGNDTEFWMGNDASHQMTMNNGKEYMLQFDLKDFSGNHEVVTYSNMTVQGEWDKYRLTIGAFTGGAAGDSFRRHDGLQFTTADSDNDAREPGSCGVRFGGGWWYQACHDAHFTGLYGPSHPFAEGMTWRTWLGYNAFLSFVEMKIRPV